mmetsp:Transcript_40576/g.107246  ORF Transcript_40576/g.107246 Transcript_40576/m.107246 type:complete len:110 (-) Transcript_40576:123-452(-)
MAVGTLEGDEEEEAVLVPKSSILGSRAGAAALRLAVRSHNADILSLKCERACDGLKPRVAFDKNDGFQDDACAGDLLHSGGAASGEGCEHLDAARGSRTESKASILREG